MMGMYYVFAYFVLCVVFLKANPRIQRKKFCYKRLCLCSGEFASCNNKGTKLTYIPPLPPHITKLNFSGNSLDIVNKQTFNNISNLKLRALFLRQNRISLISTDAFQSFAHLKSLDLSLNPINLSSLKELLTSFGSSVITLITLSGMGYGERLYEAITLLNSTTIEELKLPQNKLRTYNQTLFKHLHRLTHVDLDENYISDVSIDDSAIIQTMSAVKNRLTNIPQFCSGDSNLYLTNLFLDDNQIRSISQMDLRCLKKLKILTLNRNPITYIHTSTFSVLTSLEILKLQRLTGPLKYIDAFAFNNSKLFKLVLQENDLGPSHLNLDMFQGCYNLKRLLMPYNHFYHLLESEIAQLLRPLTNLRKLDLGSCKLRSIPRVITNNLTQLTWLSLFKNLIRSWSPGTFDNLRNLNTLYLGCNRISYIEENSFSNAFRNQLTSINLAGNQFDCSCQLLWFLNWFKRNRTIFKQSDDVYICMSPKSAHNVKLVDFHISERQCLLTEMSIFVIVVVTSVLICITIIASAVYRKRWALRYYFYMRKYRQQIQQELEEDYVYDVFVMYCEDDFQWIIGEMLPFLEDTKGLMLCIQHRDFELGKPIIDNIVHCVNQSRNFILVASNSFVEEEWCQYELMLIQTHLQERQLGRLVVILLEDIDHRHMSPTVYAVLKTKEYIYWPQHHEDKDRFWQHIYNELTQV